MYSQFELDHMDENTYREFLFWDGQISKEALDNPPNDDTIDNMKDTEIQSDLWDEYLAIQEAEMNMDAPDSYQLRGTSEEEMEAEALKEAELGQEPEIASDEEIKVLMRELWEEFVPAGEEPEYTERDVFNDFISDQYEDFNE